MTRTKQYIEDAFNITYVGPGYTTVIVATVYGADAAVELGQLIAATSQIDTVYAAISPCETELLGVWDSGTRIQQRACSAQQRADAVANMSAIELLECGLGPRLSTDDSSPDGPCEITRWLEQQFGPAA
jgi:hypothetical protein